MNPNARRILLALLTLALVYWGLFVLEVPTPASREQARAHRLQEESQTLYRADKFAEALIPTQRLHQEFPDNHIYIERLAKIQNRLGHFREEAALWEKYLAVAPSPGDACPAIGVAYENLGLIPEAVRAYERCQALEPKNPDMAIHLARAYESAGERAKAKAWYAKWMVSNPGYPDFKIGFTRLEFFYGSTEKAHILIQEVLAKSPENADALLVYGMILRSLGNGAKAKEVLEQGLRRKPGYTDFYIVLGGIAEHENRTKDAIAYYTKALELNPKKADVAKRLQNLKKGKS